ncbi:MAG: hypothetical protein V9G10_13680 [Candidatus Nanopelagicales bacterium]
MSEPVHRGARGLEVDVPGTPGSRVCPRPVDGVDLEPAPRRDRRAGRGERVRQDDARPARCSASRSPRAARSWRRGRAARRTRRAALKKHCGVPAQLVLQDPTGALNPRRSVYEAVAEGLRVHRRRLRRGGATSQTPSRARACVPRSGSSCATRTNCPAVSGNVW